MDAGMTGQRPPRSDENAPAAGGHQREGEDQNTNTHEGEPIMPETIAPATQTANEHPELALAARSLGRTTSSIARDAWASETEILGDATDPMTIHSHEFASGRYTLTIAHTIAGIDLGTDVIVKWVAPEATGGQVPEEFSVDVTEIPGLIAALQAAHMLTCRTSDGARYLVVGTDIHDRESGRVAKFQHAGVAQIGADWLNGPDGTPESYDWTPAETDNISITPEPRASRTALTKKLRRATNVDDKLRRLDD